MTEQERWEPDPMLVDAATDGRLDATAMPDEDRAYVVAVLSERGESADQIANRLHCSPRLVKRIRAEPLTVTLRRTAQVERVLAAAESKARHLELLRAREADDAVDTTGRLRAQLDDLVEQLRRTRADLDHERAERWRRADVHIHVYRRKPTTRQVAADATGSLFDLDTKENR